MAVDDDELLRLAGGDSSDEEEPSQQPSTNRNAYSPLPSIEISQAASNKPTEGKPRSSPAARSSNKAKKSRKHDSEEEGEA